jgi:hypothetical protein
MSVFVSNALRTQTLRTNEVLLLPLEFNRFLHLTLLKPFSPLLWTDIGDAAEDALELAQFVFFWKRREEDPSVALIAISVLP